MTPHVDQRLSAYIVHELAAAEREEVASHLATCPDCSRALEELQGVVAMAQALEDRPPEAELWPELAAARRGSRPTRRTLRLRASTSPSTRPPWPSSSACCATIATSSTRRRSRSSSTISRSSIAPSPRRAAPCSPIPPTPT